MKTYMFWVALSLLLLAGPGQSGASPAPQPNKAIGIDDPGGNVIQYAARMRLTKGTWDYLKITLRDTFKKWDYKGGDGFNLLLDSGYIASTHSAGPIRTTPFEKSYAYYDSKNTPNWTQQCGGCEWYSTTCFCSQATCGVSCGGWSSVWTGWTQVRKPGYNLGDTPGQPWECRDYGFQEYGFYIPAVGTAGSSGPCGIVAGAYFDYSEFQACSNHYNYDVGSGKAGVCPTAPLSLLVSLHYNLRIFFYPNMRQEYALDPIDNWNPGTRGPYIFSPIKNVPYSVVTNCTAGGSCPVGGGQCCDTLCTCGSWGICSYTDRQIATCNTNYGTATYNSHFGSLPQNTGAYDPSTAYNTETGTYFRSGDDTAIYTSIYQMQIQSINRANAYKPATCGADVFYTGLVGAAPGTPNYLQDDQPLPTCMRPKMYWDQNFPASQGGPKWRQCEPFDTWNTDKTLNPANDDDKFIYPGNSVDGKGFDNVTLVSPGRCGRQNCTVTGGTCTSSASGWAWAAGSKTGSLDDLYSDNDGINNALTGQRRGTGWYGLKLDPGFPQLNPAANRIDIQFSGKDMRLEMATEADVFVDAGFLGTFSVNDNIVVGRLLVDKLTISASLYLYSIDDASCSPANAASCSGFWRGINASTMLSSGASNPDKLVIDSIINGVTIDPGNGGSWYVGSTTCILDIPLIGCVVTMEDILNNSLIQGQLLPPIQDAIKDALKGALGSISSAVPNLNGILGNPINMGTALIDSGIFIAGASSGGVQANPPDPLPLKWPVKISTGPAADRHVVDMRLSVGFKPIAFKMPIGANNVLDIDTAEPPAASSVYGVAELWKTATKAATSCPHSGSAASPDTCPAGVFTTGAGCSLPAHFATKDTDQIHDGDDYCRGKKSSTLDAFYFHPKTGVKTYVAHPHVIPDFWKGPITKFKKAPAWCMVVGTTNAPRTLRLGATPNDLKTLYPSYPDIIAGVPATWLSFDDTLDTNPAGATVPRNTIGTWDSMPSNSVMLQGNINNGVQNSGVLDGAAIPYDFSMHIHQRTFVEFAQTAFAAGVGCLEFGAQDTTGADAPWKSLFAVERFSAFIPEIQTLFPHGYAKMRIMPLQTPRIRVGMGNLAYTPISRTKYGVNGALPVANEPYTLSMALPDLQVQFLVDSDPNDLGNPAKEVKLLTLKWNTVVGFYAKAVRQCYHGSAGVALDPLYNDPECTSPFTNVRTVSGYYELFFDLNGQSISAAGKKTGTNMLGKAWEAPANMRDGFAAGRFSNESFACPGCVAPNVAVPSGEAMFEVTQSYCTDQPTKCKILGLAQSVPSLLSSTLQMFLVTRLNFYNLTIDFLYMGPDGPNNDGLGTAKAAPFNRINGDYLAIYARFLGNLNVFGLLDSAAMLAPREGGLKSQAIVKDVTEGQFVRTGNPEFAIELRKSQMAGNLESQISYTFSVDDGFWHTPVDFATLQLSGLTEGEHKLSLRSFEDTEVGATTNLTPTVLRFSVDTLPPKVEILPSKEGYFTHKVNVKSTDLQTPTEKLKNEYSWDDTNDWQEMDGAVLSVGNLKKGRHVLRVQSTDLAGNVGASAREIVVNSKGWGCSSSGSGDASPVLILLAFMAIAFRGRRRA